MHHFHFPIKFSRNAIFFLVESLSFCRTISNAKIKTVKLTVVVVLGHLFCSVPYVFIQLYTVWGNPTPEDSEFLPRFGMCVQFLKR